MIRERMAQTRVKVVARQRKEDARPAKREIEKYCAHDEPVATLLEQVVGRLGLSEPRYLCILGVARTIADLKAVRISDDQEAEPIQYGRFDRALH